VRTFIAIDLDPAVKRSLSELIVRLRKAAPEGTSWARESGMHLTLKFLGEIDDSRIEAVAGIMDAAAASIPPFAFQVRGTGAFPNTRFPRILWAGVAPSAELDALQSRLDSELGAIGFERESRPFHPHLTLGRVRTASKVRAAVTELELQKYADFGTMTGERIILFRSVLTPAGAEYSVLKEAPFR
jgi:2'-5' RNA ligase